MKGKNENKNKNIYRVFALTDLLSVFIFLYGNGCRHQYVRCVTNTDLSQAEKMYHRFFPVLIHA